MEKTYIIVDDIDIEHTHRVISMIAAPSDISQLEAKDIARGESIIMYGLWGIGYIPKMVPMLYEVVILDPTSSRYNPFSLS